MMYMLYIYIYIYIIYIYILYIHIHIKVNYVINRIYEKTFRSDLSTQKKAAPLTNYLLPVTW